MLISIIMVPFYIKYLGVEAYGLVGFFALLQALFYLLDIGLTPTMGRQTACYRGGEINGFSLRRLLRTMEVIFYGVALLGAICLTALSGKIANQWLNVENLSPNDVKTVIILMAPIVAFRWLCNLYRGVVYGFERFMWLGSFSVVVATARSLLVIPFFIYISTDLTAFFKYQLGIASIEFMVLIFYAYRLMPKVNVSEKVTWEWQPLRGMLKFSLSIAFTSSVWLLVTQTDKLVLSKLLSLTDYGYFTLACVAAGGILMVSAPISGALMPRMTKMHAEGNEAGLIRLYRNGTQMVAVIVIPATLMLACLAEKVLWAWTGNVVAVTEAAPVLVLYTIGNGIIALGGFPYLLQFAKGDLKFHVIGNALLVMVLIPSLILATVHYGMIGAGWAWLTSNTVYFIFWVPMVHNRFVKGLHVRWLLHDIGLIGLLSVIGLIIVMNVFTWPHERLALTGMIAVASLSMLPLAALGSSWVRETLCYKLRVMTLSKG
jgi:O-antigen/teichoic acid export membrane protein